MHFNNLYHRPFDVLFFVTVTRLRSESPLNHSHYFESNATKNSSFDKREERRDSIDYYKSSFSSDVKDKSYDMTDSAYSTSRVNKKDAYSTRYGSESPMNRTASPITTKHLGSGSRLDPRSESPYGVSSPYRSTSPYRASSPYRTPSPLSPLRKDGPLNRTSSPIGR